MNFLHRLLTCQCLPAKGHFCRLGPAASHVSVLTDLQSEEKVQMVETGRWRSIRARTDLFLKEPIL